MRKAKPFVNRDNEAIMLIESLTANIPSIESRKRFEGEENAHAQQQNEGKNGSPGRSGPLWQIIAFADNFHYHPKHN